MPSLHNSYQHLIYRKWFWKLHINPVLSLRVSYFFHIFTLFAYCNKIYIKASISIYLVCLYALNLAACFAIVRAMVWSLFSVNDINSPHCSIESLITLSSIENGEKCQWCKWNTQLHKHPFIYFCLQPRYGGKSNSRPCKNDQTMYNLSWNLTPIEYIVLNLLNELQRNFLYLTQNK